MSQNKTAVAAPEDTSLILDEMYEALVSVAELSEQYPKVSKALYRFEETYGKNARRNSH